MQDANWNVVAICDMTGTVQERYAYTPYGVVTVYDPSWEERSSGSFAWQYLFQGGRFEVLTGVVLFPKSGLFLLDRELDAMRPARIYN